MGGGPCTRLGAVGRSFGTSLLGSWIQFVSGLNQAVAESPVGRFFNHRKTTFTSELRAGTAILTLAYIISVNAAILTDSDGPCTVHHCTPTNTTIPPGPECKFDSNPSYEECLSLTRSDLVVATILTTMIGSFAMGSFVNLPLAIAPAWQPTPTSPTTWSASTAPAPSPMATPSQSSCWRASSSLPSPSSASEGSLLA